MGALVLIATCGLAVGCSRPKPDATSVGEAASRSPASTATIATAEPTLSPPAQPPPVEAVVSPARAVEPTTKAQPEPTAAPAAAGSSAPHAEAASHDRATQTTAAEPPAHPAIYSAASNPSVLHAGDPVSWDVRTSTDIVSVVANVLSYHIPLQRVGAGHFMLSFTVPKNVPGFFHGSYALDVHAETAAGASADRSMPVAFE